MRLCERDFLMKKYIILGAFVMALSMPVMMPKQAHAYANIITDIQKVKDTAEQTIDGVRNTVNGIKNSVESGIEGYRNGIKSQIPYL